MTPTEGHDPRTRRPADPQDPDPTGIRDLLAALPDPGPMPQDLVDRISSRLAMEQAHRDGSDAAGNFTRPDAVLDLAAERSRRRPARTVAYLGVAAAGLLLTTVAVGELGGAGLLGGTAGPDSAAQVSTQSRAADGAGSAAADAGGEPTPAEAAAEAAGQDTAGGGDTDQDLGQEAAADDAAGGSETGVQVDLLPPLGEVTRSTYRQVALEAVVEQDDDNGRGASAGLTQTEAERCWQVTADDQAWPALHAAGAELDGVPVVVLIGQDGGSSGSAVLVPWSCTSGVPVEPLAVVTWGS